MGAHHFKFNLIPIGFQIVRDADGECADFLLNHSLPETMVAELRGLLPKPNHWCEVEEYGSANKWGSDIRICFENQKIVDIAIRYAPNCDALEIFRKFVELAKAAGCDLLIASTGEIVPADFTIAFEALKKHRAYVFLSDPMKAIKEAANEMDSKNEQS